MKLTEITHRPYILLTNDDGVNSPGLHALTSAILPFADIEIIAPSHQMTATGRGLFGDRGARLKKTELMINQVPVIAHHAPCSPAQVVLLGVQIFGVDRKPDLLISGINYGENLGRDITMSGTIGAAIQAACMGIPALAVSRQTPVDQHFAYGSIDWEIVSHFAALFANLMLERKLPNDVDILKIDVPQDATRNTPWRVTRVAGQSYFTAEIPSPTMSSRLSDSKVSALREVQHLEKDSDIYTFLTEGTVCVTPISLDFTSRVDLGELQEYLKNGD